MIQKGLLHLEREFGQYGAIFQTIRKNVISREGRKYDQYNLIEIPRAIVLPNELYEKVLLRGMPADTQYGGALATNTSYAIWRGYGYTISTQDIFLHDGIRYEVTRSTYDKKNRYYSAILTEAIDVPVFSTLIEESELVLPFRDKVILDKLYRDLKYKVTDFSVLPELGDLLLDNTEFTQTGSLLEAGMNGGFTFTATEENHTITPMADFNLTLAYRQPEFEVDIGTIISHTEGGLDIGGLYSVSTDTNFNVLSIDCTDGIAAIYLNGVYKTSVSWSTALESLTFSSGSVLCTLYYSEPLGEDAIYISTVIEEYNRRLGRTDD